MNIEINGATLIADPSGALWWPAHQLLAFADLHFEKGSAYAGKGALLPPYDTRATLARVSALIARYDPAIVVCLGDSFHDVGGPGRLDPEDAGAYTNWGIALHNSGDLDGAVAKFRRAAELGELGARDGRHDSREARESTARG